MISFANIWKFLEKKFSKNTKIHSQKIERMKTLCMGNDSKRRIFIELNKLAIGYKNGMKYFLNNF